MLVPPKGDYSMLPLNPEGRKIADSWDLAKSKADPDQCKAYGPPALMRVPGRLNIHWTDDNTLQLDTDSGTQTRTFRFGGTPRLQVRHRSFRATPSRRGSFSARAAAAVPWQRAPVSCACGRRT